MTLFFRTAILVSTVAAAFSACSIFEEPVERICPNLPLAEFSPDSSVGYGVKDNLLVTIRPFAIEDAEKYTCPATICFTLDGSDPELGRASTQCLAAPVKRIPIKRSTCIKYFVVGHDGTQSVTQEECYRVEPPPVSYCEPKGKSSREPLTVSLISSKAGTIFYTLDGSDPDPYGESAETLSGEAPKVEVRLDFEGSTTIKFRAQDKDGNIEEKVNTCEFKYDPTPPVTLVTPSGSPSEHVSSAAVNVSLEADELASIYYTLDGSEPSPSKLVESGLGSTQVEFSSAVVAVAKSSVLRAYAVDLVGNEEDPIQQHVYLINGVPAIALSHGGGAYEETEISITVTTFPANTQVKYTTDGATEPVCGGAGTIYGPSPITSFTQPGDYTLKYRACYGVGNNTAGPVYTANYTLGASGRPYPVLLDFNNIAQYDAAGSSKTVEHNTHKGYVRLRPKMPEQIGSGYDGIAGNNYLDLPQEVEINNSYLFYAAGNALRVYNLDPLSASGSNTFPVDSPSFTTPYCSTSKMNGALLGINIFNVGSDVYAITPWTDRGIINFGTGQLNCGGFARWNMNVSGSSSSAYIKGGLPQFSGPPDDPFITDTEEVTADHLPNLPKTDSAVSLNPTWGAYISYQPQFRDGAHRVDGFFAMTGNRPITSATSTSGRPIALELGLGGTVLAVGDSQGEIYTLNTDDLSQISHLTIDCPTGSRCRINGLAWYTAGLETYLLAAVGYYGGARGGQIAIAKVSALGVLTAGTSTALPATDPFKILSPVEGIAILPQGNHAVVALREQGAVVIDLSGVASNTVASRGYIDGNDIADNAFWASDVVAYPAILGVNGVAMVDSGRTATALDAGFRLFKIENPNKFETSGYFQSANLNASAGDTAIGRAKLVETVPSLPLGVRITFVTDGEYLDDPIAEGGTIVFPEPATDLRVRVEFASQDSGTTTPVIQSIKLQLTPVE